MPNITFSNPGYKDKTIYATAGSHTETILRIARANRIPIEFSCEDGKCGSCQIRVLPLDRGRAMGGPLTEREKSVLVAAGKLTSNEIEQMALDDLPSPWRLACQMIVRDENVLVEY